MASLATQVKNADRMMTAAKASEQGIELSFADGCTGVIPFDDIPEIGSLPNLNALDLPNPFELVLRSTQGDSVALPWDFGRHYCDPSYKPRVEAVAGRGLSSLGKRIRRLRETAGLTQGRLADAAGIGRITLVRIESGEQSPRYETLVALAAALGRPTTALLFDEPAVNQS